MLKRKTLAPDFELKTINGMKVTLSEFRGTMVFLFFFRNLKDLECQYQCVAMAEVAVELAFQEVAVIGIGPNSVKDIEKFQDKYDVEFLILSDSWKKVMKPYGACINKYVFGRNKWVMNRCAYLIDENGIILKTYNRMKACDFDRLYLNDIYKLRKKQHKKWKRPEPIDMEYRINYGVPYPYFPYDD